MAAFETYVEKYVRLSDDLHEVSSYLNDIRVCLVVLTASCYLAILAYALVLCVRRRPGGGPDEESALPASKAQQAKDEDDWRDSSPPRPGAVHTADGYRYKSPTGARATGRNRYNQQDGSPDLSSSLIAGRKNADGFMQQYS